MTLRFAAACAALLFARPAAAEEASLRGLDARLASAEIAYWLHADPKPPKVVSHPTSEYFRAYLGHFKSFRGHPAVSLSAKIRIPGPDAPRPSLIRARAVFGMENPGISPELARNWRRALADFRDETGLNAFILESRKPYKPYFDEFEKRLKKEAYVAVLEDYTRLKFEGAVRIVFSPSLEILDAGYGDAVHVRREDGNTDIYVYLSPLMLGDLPEAGLPEDIPLYLWHEVGHTLVDPLVKKHWSEIAPRLDRDTRDHYANDIFAQAVSIRLFARRDGEAAVAKHLSYEEPRERAYLEPLARTLKDYEENPKAYATLADFFPRLINALPPAGGD